MGTVSNWPERLSSNNKKRVIQELVHGQECASQLQILFHKSSVEEKEELVQQILRSFNESLLVLSCNGSAISADISQNQANSKNGDDRRSEDSSESRKRSPAVASKDRRGCYKRKRGAHTWTIDSTTMEDGHSWRKYGQKDILGSKHPRSYFRCTRKFDQGCRATRQVQRIEGDDGVYQITYIGTHTCKDSFKPPEIITPAPRVMKQEFMEEATPMGSDLTDLDSMIMWKDIMDSDGFDEYSSNVYSCSTEISSRNFELDLVIKPVEFDIDFQFDD